MRTTIALDDDVLALVAAEQRRTGETKGQVVGRLIRRGVGEARSGPTLPLIAGTLHLDVSDVSTVLLDLDEGDQRRRPEPGSAP